MTRPPRLGVTRAVFNRRNSACNVPMDWLDTEKWYMDAWASNAWRYLHVPGLASADPKGEYGLATRVFRVYPRKIKGRPQPVTLSFKDGKLYWKYGPTKAEQARHDAWLANLFPKEQE